MKKQQKRVKQLKELGFELKGKRYVFKSVNLMIMISLSDILNYTIEEWDEDMEIILQKFREYNIRTSTELTESNKPTEARKL